MYIFMATHTNIGIPFYFLVVSLHVGEPFTQYLPPSNIIYRTKKKNTITLQNINIKITIRSSAAVITCPSLGALEYRIYTPFHERVLLGGDQNMFIFEHPHHIPVNVAYRRYTASGCHIVEDIWPREVRANLFRCPWRSPSLVERSIVKSHGLRYLRCISLNI